MTHIPGLVINMRCRQLLPENACASLLFLGGGGAGIDGVSGKGPGKGKFFSSFCQCIRIFIYRAELLTKGYNSGYRGYNY